MLTEQERKWLRGRDLRAAPCDNELPGIICDCCVEIIGVVCPLKPDYRDAAEFEARVAERLAGAWAIGEDMCFNNHCQLFDKDRCTACYLKNARIAVEEEMDNERNHA